SATASSIRWVTEHAGGLPPRRALARLGDDVPGDRRRSAPARPHPRQPHPQCDHADPSGGVDQRVATWVDELAPRRLQPSDRALSAESGVADWQAIPRQPPEDLILCWGAGWGLRHSAALMRPGTPAPEAKVVGVGLAHRAPWRGLHDVIGDAVA